MCKKEIKQYIDIVNDAISSRLQEELSLYGIKVVEAGGQFELYLTASDSMPPAKFYKETALEDMPKEHLDMEQDEFDTHEIEYKLNIKVDAFLTFERYKKAYNEAFVEAWLELLKKEIVIHIRDFWEELVGEKLTRKEVVDILKGKDRLFSTLSRFELESFRNKLYNHDTLEEHPLNYDDVYDQVSYSEEFEENLKERLR